MDFDEEDLLDMNDDIVVEEELIKLSEAAESNRLPEQTKTEPGPEHLEVLLKYFGHTSFRPLQWEIISSIIIDKRDVCAIMCTGYGKSLCFQFPSVFTGGVTLVISPLIALMEDQVLSLMVANIPACLLGTAQQHSGQVMIDIFENKYSLIYLTPEFCTGSTGSEMLKRMSHELQVTLIAVDEAHCISSWGHDFRFQYRKLGCLHDIFPTVPIIAVTATATQKVREDIMQNLRLSNPLFLCSGFDRPNLYFEVFPKGERRPEGEAIYADLIKSMVFRDNVWKFSGPTIIYCITRKQTEEVSDLLRAHGINSLPYHAGLNLKLRKETHEKFVRDQIDVIVGTIAFGMGIDKPDIANIVHYGASKSIENYYQEVGRAGRDGNPARCVAFFSDFDFWLIRKIQEHIKTNEEEREAKLEQMEHFLTSRDCRRRFILSYFDDLKTSQAEPQENCCDNCTRRRYDRRSTQEIYEGLDEQGRYNFSNDARIVLDTIAILEEPFGLTTYVAFIRGGQEGKLYTHQSHPLYGVGKEKPNPWWKTLAKMLIEEHYLREVPQLTAMGYPYNTLTLTADGSKLLSELNRDGTKFLRPPPPPLLKLLKPKRQRRSGGTNINAVPSSSVILPETPEEIELKMKIYQQLVNKRTELAAELDCMPYMVASNTALMTIAACRPRTLNAMRDLNLDGLTQAKLRKFGDYFLQIVTKMTSNVTNQKTIVPANTSTESNQKKLPIKDILDRHPLPQNSSLNFSAGVSCALYQSGLSVDEISAKRKISLQTVTSHLISGILSGYPISIVNLGVTKQCRDAIMTVFNKYYSSNIAFADMNVKTIKSECPSAVTLDHVKAVLAYLQVRYHLEQLNIAYEEFESFKFSEICTIKPIVKRVNDAITVTNKENLQSTNNTPENLDEPPMKKEKSDYNLILDSPPHTMVSGGDDSEPEPEVITIIIEDDLPNLKNAIIAKPKKKEKQLPPWLIKKKIN